MTTPNPSEKEMWAIFSDEDVVALKLGSEDDARWFARGLLGKSYKNISIHQLVTITESQSAYARGVEDAATICDEIATEGRRGETEKYELAALRCRDAIRRLTQGE